MKISTITSRLLEALRPIQKLVLDKYSEQIKAHNLARTQHTNELTGQKWALEAEKMLRTDAKLFGAAQQLRNSMLSATWYVEAADDSDEARRNAQFIRAALGLDGELCHLQSGSFESELRKIIDFVFVGHQECEEVYYERDGMIWLSEVADISGIVLTKMDGTAKGGIAVAIQSELQVPVKYIGVGETIDDLQKFNSDDFVNALFNQEV